MPSPSWRAFLIAAAALAAALSFPPAAAEATDACITPAAIAAQVLRVAPDARAFIVEDPAALAELTRWFNRLAPVSHIEADRIVAFETEGIPEMLIVFFFNGCKTGSVPMPKPFYRLFVPAGLAI